MSNPSPLPRILKLKILVRVLSFLRGTEQVHLRKAKCSDHNMTLAFTFGKPFVLSFLMQMLLAVYAEIFM